MTHKQEQHHMADDVVDRYLAGTLSRRAMIRRATALGISVPVLSAALGARGAIAQSTPSPVASATPGASPVAAISDDQVQFGNYDGKTIKVSVALAESEVTVFNNVIVDGFKEKTGGTLELVNIEAADVVRTLTAQVESGNVQLDLLVQDNNTLAPLVDGGLVEELPQVPDSLPSTTLEGVKKVLQFDGKYYFMPARPNVQITYYNEAKFGDYGVETPTTWDDLSSTAQTIKDKAGVGQVSIQGVGGGPVGVTVTQFLWQAGGDPLEINNDAGKQAFQFMQDLKPNLTPQYPTATFDTTNTYLLNQSVVLAQNWPFGVNVIVGDGGMTDVKVYKGWSGPAGEALVLGGDVFGVAKGTQEPDMAFDVAKYWTLKSVQEQLTAQAGWASMRSDALGAVEDWQKPYFEVVNEAMQVTQPRPNVTYWGQVEQILTNAFNDIVSNGQPVEDTLNRYQGEIDPLKG